MLKKLVKYGNSNALILDRAIMELLNIKEGSVVKLRTDGKALIITPAEKSEENAHATITLDGLETLANINEKQLQSVNDDPEKKRLMAEWAPGTENHSRLMEVLTPITAKHSKDMHKLCSEEFLAQVDALAAKHHGNKSSQEFIKDYNVLRNTYVPNFQAMMLEVREVYKKVGYPVDLVWDSECDWK